jgi:glycosyltransferase involved in cell wall biosynthesis
MSMPTPLERARQARRLVASEGLRGVAGRLLERAALRVSPAGERRLAVGSQDLRRAGEILAAGLPHLPPLPHVPGQPLHVAWVCAPPGEGAGGFSTMARLIEGLQDAGHTCVLYLHDRHGWPLKRHRQTIADWWPGLNVEVRDVAAGIADAHAIFATSWETAYPVLTSPARGARLYLVQDHEPAFHPAGSVALLAAATYRFGFHGVTAGRWLTDLLEGEYGMSADWFDFGCEQERYHLRPGAGRTGVCLYCRPSTPRRGFELALAALELFAQWSPRTPIHLFGEPAGRLPFPATDHGLLSPDALNELYNRCVTGLVISATNVSLVPYEMLAAGCIPLLNDAEHNRVVLDNEHIVYAQPTPYALASALLDLTRRPPQRADQAARQAARSVRHASWPQASRRVEQIVSERVRMAGELRISGQAQADAPAQARILSGAQGS